MVSRAPLWKKRQHEDKRQKGWAVSLAQQHTGLLNFLETALGFASDTSLSSFLEDNLVYYPEMVRNAANHTQSAISSAM